MPEKQKRKNEAKNIESDHGQLQRFIVKLTIFAIGGLLFAIPLSVVLFAFVMIVNRPTILDSCEVTFSENDVYRVQVIESFNWIEIHYQFSRDERKRWSTFYKIHPSSALVQADCKNFNYYDENLNWLIPYSSESLIVTHDAGMTWYNWQVIMAEYPEGFYCHQIVEVHFQSDQYGTMQVGCRRYHPDGGFMKYQNINLFTADGGISWELTYE